MPMDGVMDDRVMDGPQRAVFVSVAGFVHVIFLPDLT